MKVAITGVNRTTEAISTPPNASRSAGFSTIWTLTATSTNWIGQKPNNAEVTTPPYYGDNPDDHEDIDFGYDLFESDYPNYPDVGFNDIPTDTEILDAVYQYLCKNT